MSITDCWLLSLWVASSMASPSLSSQYLLLVQIDQIQDRWETVLATSHASLASGFMSDGGLIGMKGDSRSQQPIILTEETQRKTRLNKSRNIIMPKNRLPKTQKQKHNFDLSRGLTVLSMVSMAIQDDISVKQYNSFICVSLPCYFPVFLAYSFSNSTILFLSSF